MGGLLTFKAVFAYDIALEVGDRLGQRRTGDVLPTSVECEANLHQM